MHIAMLIAAAAAPATLPGPEEKAQARTEVREKCGVTSRQSLTNLPELRRSEALACVLTIGARYLNVDLPSRINPSLVAQSITAQGRALRFAFRVHDPLAADFEKEMPRLLVETRAKLCRGSKFTSFTELGATLALRFEDPTGRPLLETELQAC